MLTPFGMLASSGLTIAMCAPSKSAIRYRVLLQGGRDPRRARHGWDGQDGLLFSAAAAIVVEHRETEGRAALWIG